MCCGCWAEEGSPQNDTPAVREIVERLKLEDSFGRFHIVVEDNNMDDDSIIFCRDADMAGYHPPATDDQRKLADDLLAMTMDERVSAMGLVDGCWE